MLSWGWLLMYLRLLLYHRLLLHHRLLIQSILATPRQFHLDINIITRSVGLVYTYSDAVCEQFGPQPDVTANEDDACRYPEQQTEDPTSGGRLPRPLLPKHLKK